MALIAPYKTKFEKKTKKLQANFFFWDEFSTWKIMVSTRIKDICEKGHNLPDFEKNNRHNYSLNIYKMLLKMFYFHIWYTAKFG
jgi:hypothetical protein